MVDTDVMDFGSGFWMHKQHSRLLQSFRLARFFKGVFGLDHEVEYNGSVLHLASILVFGWKIEVEWNGSYKRIFGLDAERPRSTKSVECARLLTAGLSHPQRKRKEKATLTIAHRTPTLSSPISRTQLVPLLLPILAARPSRRRR